MSGSVITFGLLATPFFMLLRYMSKQSAVKVTADDMVKYTEAWLNCHISTGDCEAIKTLCKGKQSDISKARNEAVSLWRSKDATPLSFKSSDFSLLERFIFWLGARSLGCYGRTGKVRQMTANANMLFEEATVLNDHYFSFLDSNIDIGDLHRGPVKRPDRALQKVARKYFYDPRLLTDLVRCCVVCESITEVRQVLDLIFELSAVFGEETSANVAGNETTNEDEETLLGRSSDDNRKPKVFKLCKVKDDFTGEGLDYRYICLNLQVGWTIESESGDKLHFVTVKDFDKKHVRTHICEVQLLLRSTYDLKIGGCHDNFVKARNMLAQ